MNSAVSFFVMVTASGGGRGFLRPDQRYDRPPSREAHSAGTGGVSGACCGTATGSILRSLAAPERPRILRYDRAETWSSNRRTVPSTWPLICRTMTGSEFGFWARYK